jgi:hypothetical protein
MLADPDENDHIVGVMYMIPADSAAAAAPGALGELLMALGQGLSWSWFGHALIMSSAGRRVYAEDSMHTSDIIACILCIHPPPWHRCCRWTKHVASPSWPHH